LKQYYASRALSSVQRYRNGELEGKQEYFYENGMEKSSMTYRNGKLEGDVELFWPDGSPKRVVVFTEHRRNGWDQMWSPEGVLLDEGEFKCGEPIGTHTRRYANGGMREEIIYHSAKKTDKRYWDPQGTLLFEGVYLPDGTYSERTWNEEKKEYVERKGHWDGAKLCFP
jgi:antitoxin component YwqK of YwqJK toxin-antitoxin module